jgi:ABC-type cobalamin transport system permease subunit
MGRFMSVWLLRGARVLVALVAAALAVLLIAEHSLIWDRREAGDAPGWLALSQAAAVYLLPLTLFAFALWPRLWVLPLCVAGWLFVTLLFLPFGPSA